MHISSDDILIEGTDLYIVSPIVEMGGANYKDIHVKVYGGLFVDGYKNEFVFTILNYIPPVPNTPTYDKCHTCLNTVPHHQRAWCGKDPNNGKCVDLLSNFTCDFDIDEWMCPQGGIPSFMPVSSSNSYNDSYTCSDGVHCITSFNYTLIKSTDRYPKVFYYYETFSPENIIRKMYILLQFYMCNPSDFTLYYSSDASPTYKYEFKNNVTSSCYVDDSMMKFDLIQIYLPISDSSPWVTSFYYTKAYHNVSFTLEGRPESDLLITNVLMFYDAVNIFPWISKLLPKSIPYPRTNISLSFTGSNFLAFDYVCTFSIGAWTETTSATQSGFMSYNCTFPVNIPAPPGEGKLLEIQFSVSPVIPNMTQPLIQVSYEIIHVFNMPKVYNVDYSSGIVTIRGSGFSEDYNPVVEIYDWDNFLFNVTDITIESSLRMTFALVEDNPGSYCLQVKFFEWPTNCVQFSIPLNPTSPPTSIAPTLPSPSQTPVPTTTPTPTPTPTPMPIPIPTPTPTPTPTPIPIPIPIIPTPVLTPVPTSVPTSTPTEPPIEPPTLVQQILDYLTTNYWILIIAFILIAIPVIGVSIYCCRRNQNKKGIYELLSNVDFETEEFDAIGPNILVDPSEVTLEPSILGKGSFATVYKGEWRKTTIALKIFNSNTQDVMDFAKEVSIMLKLRHPNIVSIMGILSKPRFAILCEYMERGSLSDIIHNHNYKIQNHHICKMALDACRGMTYLHESNVIHRDLKCGNMLVDHNWSIKVSDFGLSRGIDDDETNPTMTSCGTPRYIAPEVIRKHHYTYKADVYSFAMCLYEMCTRKKPWGDITTLQIILCVGSQVCTTMFFAIESFD
eukprot:TRINITY_DN5012_c1_g1_i1.p1 TRINITY_DN5012_c1_g1~~TRINITY_DN5012_c1_g1_i1.p1  ORF type:complete len:841 (-),score=158.73 TRINITY_DN5012_c1_g1_i1:342-2864(-)